MQFVVQKYKKRLTMMQERKFNFTEFFRRLLGCELPKENSFVIDTTTQPVKKMRDEYSPRDLIYEKIKHLYEAEIKGPTLKQMYE